MNCNKILKTYKIKIDRNKILDLSSKSDYFSIFVRKAIKKVRSP